MKKWILLLLIILLPSVLAVIPKNIDLQMLLRDSSNNLQSITETLNISINSLEGSMLYSTKQSITFI